MGKTILYRLFGLGAVPKGLRSELDREEIVVLDEGIGGWFITKHVDGPGKRYRHRREWFSGFLAVTKRRLVCYTFGKRQMNIALTDPKFTDLYVDLPSQHELCISFESSLFREGWRGVIEFQFNTDHAVLFRDALVAAGAQRGTAPQVASA